MQGYTYIDFIVPGLVLMSVITGAYTNVASSFFSAKFQRFIEEIMVSPVPNHVILIGYLIGGMVRGILVGIIVLGVSSLFATVNIVSPLIAVTIFILTALVFSLGGMLNGMFARKFDDVSIIPNFRAHTADLSRWRFLLGSDATGVLATCFAGESDPVCDQRRALRLSGIQ